MSEVLEPKFDHQQALPYGGEAGVVRSPKYGNVSHSDMLRFIQTRRAGRAVHSDGFLSVSGLVEAAYECPSCLFNGLIADTKCAKCGRPLDGEI